ncbi:MAG: hypothetical protein R3A13_03945 [Bdellovibrionota bacterium]
MVKIETLDNGLVVIVEEIQHVESAAYNLFILELELFLMILIELAAV